MAHGRRRDDEHRPSRHDVLQIEATEHAADAALDVLKRFRAARPDYLPKGLPREIIVKLAADAISGWVCARAEQAQRIGVGAGFIDAWVTGEAWPDPGSSADFMD